MSLNDLLNTSNFHLQNFTISYENLKAKQIAYIFKFLHISVQKFSQLIALRSFYPLKHYPVPRP